MKFETPVQDLSPGDVLLVDAGFTCVGAYQMVGVLSDEDESRSSEDLLYFKCRDGRHYLSGQLSQDCSCYVGILKVSAHG